MMIIKVYVCRVDESREDSRSRKIAQERTQEQTKLNRPLVAFERIRTLQAFYIVREREGVKANGGDGTPRIDCKGVVVVVVVRRRDKDVVLQHVAVCWMFLLLLLLTTI